MIRRTGLTLLLVVLLLGNAVAANATVDAATARRRLARVLEADMAASPGIPGEVVAVRAPGLDETLGAGLADVRAGLP